MSRIGKNPINLPDGVDVKIQGKLIAIKGPKGELKWNFPPELKVSLHDKSLIVERPSDIKQLRSLHGTTRSIIANMITGVANGYQKILEITGVGYRVQVQGRKIVFNIGYSHPVEFILPDGVSAQVDNRQTQLTLQGIDKQLVGQIAADIRTLRPPNVYKGKGIRYAGEMVRLKAGKAGKK